jgi:hypothetical protein
MKTIKYPVIFTAVALGLSSAAWAAGGSATDTRASQSGASMSGQTTAQSGQPSGSQMGSGSQGSSGLGASGSPTQSGQPSGSQMGSGSQGSSGLGASGGMGSSASATGTESEAEARQLLQAEGYSNITGLEAQSGSMFQAKADKNGQPVDVTIDITEKTVTER